MGVEVDLTKVAVADSVAAAEEDLEEEVVVKIMAPHPDLLPTMLRLLDRVNRVVPLGMGLLQDPRPTAMHPLRLPHNPVMAPKARVDTKEVSKVIAKVVDKIRATLKMEGNKATLKGVGIMEVNRVVMEEATQEAMEEEEVIVEAVMVMGM